MTAAPFTDAPLTRRERALWQVFQAAGWVGVLYGWGALLLDRGSPLHALMAMWAGSMVVFRAMLALAPCLGPARCGDVLTDQDTSA